MIVLVGQCGLERLATALRARGEAVAVLPPDAAAIRALDPELVYADPFDATWSVPLVAAAFAGREVEPGLELAKATLGALDPFPLVVRAPRRPPAGAFGLEVGLPPALEAAFSEAETLVEGRRTVRITGLWARHGILDDGVRFGPGHGEPELGPLGTSRLTGQDAADVEAEAVLAWRDARCRRGFKGLIVDLDGVLVHGELAATDFGELNPAWAAAGSAGNEDAWWRAPRALHMALRVCQSRGLALALCTRNDPALVERAFRLRPRSRSPWSAALHDALLDYHSFDLVEAGFGPKSAACRRIAERLGASPETLVFLDDSAVERAEVAANGGGIRVLTGEVAGFAETLLSGAGFMPWATTAAAGLRSGSWRSRAAVSSAELAGEADILVFLHGLELEVELRLARIGDHDRIIELVARTNQLRLTGNLLPSPLPQALWVAACRDRLADHGLVAAAWFVGEGEARTLAELAVSCRVLPHRIAATILAALLTQEPSANVQRRDTGRNAATMGLVEEARLGPAPWVRLALESARCTTSQ